jgi:pseudaminic acid cytidylyltransferase
MRLAIIPARGGSKRIPRKNIRNFLGKPIIAYSIEAARQSKLFDQVVISTDDNEIADVARGLGAEVPFMRPEKLSDDHTGTADVVKHALSWFAEQGTPAEFACCIYATAPFVTSQDLQDGFELLSSSRKSYAFSVTSFGFSIQRALRLTEGGLEPFSPAHSETRSQDLEEAFHDAGQFYWGRATAFLSDVPLFSNASLPVVLPRYRVQDIDTVEDWQRAEFMYRALQMQRDKT